MNHYLKQISLIIALICAPLSIAYAGPITYNGYTLNEETNIVTGGGLEWLQWDVTDGMSIDTALGSVANTAQGGGWRLATHVDVAAMFNTFDFGITFDTDPKTSQSIRLAWNSLEEGPSFSFVELFGDTFNIPSLGTSTDPYVGSQALFGGESGSGYNSAFVQDDYTAIYANGDLVQRYGLAGISQDYWASSAAFTRAGVALVRDITQVGDVVQVPEPGTFALFALGLLGLGVNRRRQQRVT